ncbi:MAG: DGQHR domain-containing protein, partial [Bacteroidetes Order II. Incertae sedis bacterium]|nr:DGQHR domain-containing protein [Bacteroidetes Order II. bacterium]
LVRPCIVGTMGSTKYYETVITGRELAASVRPSMETDGWATAGIEERMQRKFDINRIRTSLVPYLASHPDRFFGSIIVLVEKGALEFEPLSAMGITDLPAAYRESASQLGFITLLDGEHIALDGQHRLLAFREVISGGSELGEFAAKVGDDEVCVLLIEFENARKTRRIFNKVNRHAKPTGRSDNIITSEDDGNAIVTRWLLDEDREAPLARKLIDGEMKELVNWTSNTLGQNSKHITTISTVYETVKRILLLEKFEGFDEKKNPVAPPDATLERAYETVSEWWETILSMDVFVDAMENIDEIKETRFDASHDHSLLLRPVGQATLVEGLAIAIERSDGSLSLAEAVRRANKINWASQADSIWRDTIVNANQRMIARKESRSLAAELIAYLIGDEYMDESLRRVLWEKWNQARGKNVEMQIDLIENEDEVPEDLPAPIDI